MDQECVNAVTPGSLVFVKDDISNRRFLCDTGASYSIFPHHSDTPPWTGPGGQRIPCWGEQERTLQLGQSSFQWIFILEDVQFPILGMDFFKHYQLLVDPAAGCLVSSRTMEVFPSCPAQHKRSSVFTAVV